MSFLPLPSGSFSVKALATVRNSSRVVGAFRPSLSSQSLRITRPSMWGSVPGSGRPYMHAVPGGQLVALVVAVVGLGPLRHQRQQSVHRRDQPLLDQLVQYVVVDHEDVGQVVGGRGRVDLGVLVGTLDGSRHQLQIDVQLLRE